MSPWYHKEKPVDWQVKNKTLKSLFENPEFDLNNVTVGDTHFSFTRDLSDTSVRQYSLSCGDDHKDNGILLLDILQQNTITITPENSSFLHNFATKYSVASLLKVTNRFVSHRSDYPPAVVILLKFWEMLFAAVRAAGGLGKILMTAWDFYGVLVIVAGVLNLIVTLSTMGLYTISNRTVVFIFICLPITLFSMYFMNLLVLCVSEFLKFNMFGSEATFWPSHQKLLVSFINVLPIKHRMHRKRLFSLGIWYNFIHGVLFIFFGIFLILQVGNKHFVPFVEVYVILFCIGIPPVKYSMLFVLYTMHAVASWFQVCRRNFRKNRDFDDPFLCSLYFSTCPWTNLIKFKEILNQSCDIPLDNTEHDVENEALSKEEDQMCFNAEKDLRKVIVNAIFSKPTAGVYCVFAAFIFMITEDAKWTAGQAFGFVIIFVLVMVPLSSSLTFPWFLIQMILGKQDTNEQARRKFAKIGEKEDYKDVFDSYISSVSKYRFLRYTSVVFNTLGIFVCFLTFMFALTYEEGDTSYAVPTTKPIVSSYTPKTDANLFQLVTSPICSLNVKGLDALQILFMTRFAGAQSYDDIIGAMINLQLFFDYNVMDEANVKLYTAPFPDPIFNSGMQHVYFAPERLHTFMIRGTKNFIDIAVDVELWFGTVIWQVFGDYIPIVNLFNIHAREYSDWLMALPKLIFRQFSLADAYMRPYLNYIQSVDVKDDEDVLIIGHSLGGGIGKILSLITGYQCVAISGPGTASTRALYRSTDPTIRTSTFVNIIPDMDVVGTLHSGNEGSVFKIPCRDGSMTCHQIDRAICQTAIMCNRMERLGEWCRHMYPESELDELYDDGLPHNISNAEL